MYYKSQILFILIYAAGHFKELASKIMHFGHTIRGTSEYWKMRKRELFSMTKQLGFTNNKN